MNHIQLSIFPITQEESEIVIARLADTGFEGFEEEENILHAFIVENKFDEKNIIDILSPLKLTFTKKIIEQKNWNEEWEKNFQPVIVDNFCIVRADFHATIPTVQHDIIITPKMSFGTGHHATTYMMISAMRHIDFKDKNVLDFGTGTGILAILAEKCGAKHVLAIDNDEYCIKNAAENIVVNQCSIITVEKRDSTQATGVFDIILANITRNIIIENLPYIWQHLTAAGVLLVSGLLRNDKEDFQLQAEKNGFTTTGFYEQGEWICLQLQKLSEKT